LLAFDFSQRRRRRRGTTGRRRRIPTERIILPTRRKDPRQR